MPKTKVKKRRVTKTKVIPNPRKTGVNKILIDNFISLQKVMTNLSLRFDELSSQISKLLELFEISAKSLAKNDFESEKGNKDSEDIIEKLDNLIDQNKTTINKLNSILTKYQMYIDYYPRIKDKKNKWVIDTIYLPIYVVEPKKTHNK